MEMTKNKNATIKNSHQPAAFQCLLYHFLLPLFLHFLQTGRNLYPGDFLFQHYFLLNF